MSANSSFNSSTVDDTALSTDIHVNKELLSAVALTLKKVLDENKNLANYSKIKKEQSKLVFYSQRAPTITLYDYLYRIQLYSEVSDSTIIIALIYIDRICDSSIILLNSNNIHRLLFGSIIAAIKYNEDTFYDNKYYAEIAGVSFKELQKIEETFLDLIQFELFVGKQQYDKYKNYLSQVCEKESLKKNE